MTRSLLETDGYKFSMAEAGYPLREETFYFTHRRGGPQLVPFDAATEIAAILPQGAPDDYAYLATHDYDMGAAFKAAIAASGRVGGKVRVSAIPKGSWFLPREPIFSVTGPSALVSWLEPLALQWSFRIQVATMAVRDPEALARAVAIVTCPEEEALVRAAIVAVGGQVPPMRVDTASYRARVTARASAIVQAAGDAARVFEVGLRAATCREQHLIALEAMRDVGIRRTSHVFAARALDLVPVGTMGHEHVQRFGSDREAFRAMRDRRPQRSSYLLDTFDTWRSGIPAAYDIIAERPEEARGDSVRFDSGDKAAQLRAAIVLARARGIEPVFILEDGLDADATTELEAVRVELGWPAHKQVYGYGGALVATPSRCGLTRDRVAAVYKLSETDGTRTMKFANEAGEGKRSVPGRPIVFRRLEGDGPLGIIGQEGELPPKGYMLLTGASKSTAADATVKGADDDARPVLSASTAEHVRALEALRDAQLAASFTGGSS